MACPPGNVKKIFELDGELSKAYNSKTIYFFLISEINNPAHFENLQVQKWLEGGLCSVNPYVWHMHNRYLSILPRAKMSGKIPSPLKMTKTFNLFDIKMV